MTENKKTSLLVPFLAGSIVGAGVALLIAPKAGKDLRNDIKDITAETGERITSALHKTRELYDGNKAAIVNAVEAGKSAYLEEKERFNKAA